MAQEQPIVGRLQLVDHLQLHSHRLLGGLEFDTDPVLLRPQVSDRRRRLLDLRAACRQNVSAGHLRTVKSPEGVAKLTGFSNRPGDVDEPRAERAHNEALVLELDRELGRRHHKRSLRHPVRGHIRDLDGTDEGRVGPAGAEGDDLLGGGCAEERDECVDGVDRTEDVDLVLEDEGSSTVIVRFVLQWHSWD